MNANEGESDPIFVTICHQKWLTAEPNLLWAPRRTRLRLLSCSHQERKGREGWLTKADGVGRTGAELYLQQLD